MACVEMQREDEALGGKLLETTTQTRQSSLAENRSPHALQNSMFLPHLLCSQHRGSSLSSYRQERQKTVCKMTLHPVELTANIKTKFSPVPDCQHFSGMEVCGNVLITKLVDRGTKEALGGQTPPLETERQVYQTNNVVFGV